MTASNTTSPIILFVGRSGCGKGTQAEFLSKDLSIPIIPTGKLLRKRAERNDYTGKNLKEGLKQGFLTPTPLVFEIWVEEFDRLKNKDDFNGFIMDGNPRKLYEAHLLEQLFEWYEWGNVTLVHINISAEEAMKRTKERARIGDTVEEMEHKEEWYKIDVTPVLEYFASKGKSIDVNGEQSEEKVYKDIKSQLGL